MKVKIGFSILVAAIAILTFILSPLVPEYGSDAEWYIALAEGRIDEVIKPFSGRFLHPFLVGLISSRLSLDINQSFLFVAVISLVFFLIINAVLLKETLQSPFLMIPIFLLPYFAMILRSFFLPDLFYIFLTALFFLLLIYRKEAVSLLALFLLFLTRESTVLLGLILSVVSFLRSRKLLAMAAFAIVALAIFTTYAISNLGLPNVHNLSNFSYLVLKIPYNLLNNLFGAELWVNTLSNNCDPVSVFNLPPYLRVGSINKIGFCGFDISVPLRTALVLLTTFGVAPLALIYLFFSNFKYIMNKLPLWLIVALIYGLVSYFVSVLITGAVQKSAGYGWPAFLLAVPFLIAVFLEVDKKFLLKLSFVQLFVAWLPIVAPAGKVFGIDEAWFVLLFILAAYVYALHLFGAQKKNLILET